MVKNTLEIDRIAALANLRLSPEEQARLVKEFPAIIRLIDEMLAVDAADLPVTNQVTDLENVYRQDDVVSYPHHRTLVEQAPVHEGGLVRVPGIFTPPENDHA